MQGLVPLIWPCSARTSPVRRVMTRRARAGAPIPSLLLYFSLRLYAIGFASCVCADCFIVKQQGLTWANHAARNAASRPAHRARLCQSGKRSLASVRSTSGFCASFRRHNRRLPEKAASGLSGPSVATDAGFGRQVNASGRCVRAAADFRGRRASASWTDRDLPLDARWRANPTPFRLALRAAFRP